MKRILFLVSIFVTLFVLSIPAFADSPITSTQFSDAYKDISIVKEASEQGTVNAKIAAYLSNAKNPIDVKAAVINALSWDANGKKANAEKYSKLIYKTSISKLKPESLSGDQLLCIGYMLAMDGYDKSTPALKYLRLAEKKINNSFTVSVVRAIVEAQGGDKDTWEYIQPVLQNNSLKRDMRQDGVNIILDYMACVGIKVSQNNMLIESETSQKVYLYGSFSLNGELPYQIVSQSDKAYTALTKDKYGIYYLNITGIINGDSFIEIKNNMNQSMKINFTVISSDTYKSLNNKVCMFIGSTKALVGKTKVAIDNNSIPYLKNNGQYIPITFANKAIGASVQTDNKKGTSKITYYGKTITIKSGSNTVSINGKTIKLKSNIETKNKQLFISAQDFATITGKKFIYYNGLIVFTDVKTTLDPITDDYIFNEISTQINNGKSVLNYPTLYKDGEKYGYKDKAGKVVIKPIYEDAFEFNEGFAAVAIKDEQGNLKYGFINVKGDFVINAIYNWAQSFNNGLAPVISNQGAGFIDKNGDIKIELNYQGAGVFGNGLAPVMGESGKWGYINTKGQLVIPYKYDDVIAFSEAMAAVKIDNKWGYIDRTGKMIIQPTFDEAGEFTNGIVSVIMNNKLYTFIKSGKIVTFFKDGGIYVGEQKNGMANGKGVYTWADGMQYSGEITDGCCTGKAVLTCPDGSIQDGYWEDGVYIGPTK